MNLLKVSTTLCSLALLGALSTPSAKADEWNNKTVITFSGPVEIPGVHLTGFSVLPAGTYVFKLLDSQSDRHIVQIYSEDMKTVYATILAIPNYRLKATSKTVMTFSERPAGEPEALRAWFYPGKNWGDEFVYPKARAIEIAKTANMPVLFTPAEIAVEVAVPVKVDAPVVVELKHAPIMAVQPSGEQVQLAAVVTAPPVEELPVAATTMPATLPATASTLPLIGMMGLIALGGALSLRMVEKRARR
jgi:hypothetical protein